MIPFRCLQALKPNDIIILDGNEKYKYILIHMFKYSSCYDEYGYIIKIKEKNDLPFNIYSKIHNITKIIKNK